MDDAVFQRVFIPSNLDEIVDIERDMRRAAAGEGDQVGRVIRWGGWSGGEGGVVKE